MASSSSSRLQRAKLRHATFVDPQTGGKSRKPFSLHHSSDGNGSPMASQVFSAQTTIPEESEPVEGMAWMSQDRPYWTRTKRKLVKAKEFMTSDLGKGMFKCALAYLVGSMATFVPALSALFGRQDSKHLVATCTVYFHPARSLGSMLEAFLLACAAFGYTATISLVSMSVSALFADVLHQIVIGHVLVLVFFVGGGLGFIGWYKLKKADPLVNIACSLACLSLITVLTKEGAVQAGDYSFFKILQYLKMIIAGVVATMLVSCLVFPISARRKLRENLVDIGDALSDMLGLITTSFISGDEQELEDQEFTSISDRHRKAAAQMAQKLKESKWEHNVFGTEKIAQLETKMASCLQRIAQSVGGLRSAAAVQFVLMKQPPPSAPFTPTIDRRNWPSQRSGVSSPAPSTFERSVVMSGFFEPPDSPDLKHQSSAEGPSGSIRSSTQVFRTPQEIFELFIDHLGPSMRSLAYTMKEILDELPFNPDADYVISYNLQFQSSLDCALALYKEARKDALDLVYEKRDAAKVRSLSVEADWEEAAACCGHFSFALVEVATQIKEFLVCLDELQVEADERPAGRTWSWLKFWKRRKASQPELESPGVVDENTNRMKVDRPKVKNRIGDRPVAADVKDMSLKDRFFRKLSNNLSFLRREDNKYGVKVGFGAMLYALPSFIPATRPIYAQWRGEWGLLSYMLVCSMTIGASNTTGYQRFGGTGLGAVLALVAWEISHDNPFVLAFFGFLMAYWTSYIIIGMGKGPMGRFIMLTYNLSALYAWSLLTADDDGDGDEEDSGGYPLVFDIASHRVVAVLSGCIWGLIITRAVWPISARRKLKDGLSLLWLRMGLIWKRDPLSVFTEGEHPNRYMNLREELELQQFCTKLDGLVEASKNEIELTRQFPHEVYSRILKRTRRMLEAFHTMNVVILKDLNVTSGEQALMEVTTKERAELCSRISHQFGVLASSMKLKYSMASDAVPSADHTRDRLLAKIFGYRRADTEEQKTSEEDYSLLYTYALVTAQIGMEIKEVRKEIEALFGVIDEESLWLQ